MTDEQLKQIEARANAATPGPWWVTDDVVWSDKWRIADAVGKWATFDPEKTPVIWANLSFIAAARTDVPALVAEVRRLCEARELCAEFEWRLTEGYSEALTLFEAMKAKHYPDSEAAPLPTTAGVVSQISNMVAGLRDKNQRLHADIERLGRERDDMARAAQELQERLSRLEDDGK
jgi:hypothetical protein